MCGGGGGLPFHRLQQTRDSFCGHAENKLEAKTDGNPSSSDQLTNNKQSDHISRVLDPNGCKVALHLVTDVDFKSGRKLTSGSLPNKTWGSTDKRIYINPKHFSHRRHKARTATQPLLEHCNGSFPETDFSQATQSAGPDGETGTNWCPLALPSLSFSSFISFVFTCDINCKWFQLTRSFSPVKATLSYKPQKNNTTPSGKASPGI